MKIARVLDFSGEEHFAGLQVDGSFVKLDSSLNKLTSQKIEVQKYLPPVVPRAIICVAASYRKHIEESNLNEQPDPVIFMKNPAAATGHKCPVILPDICDDEVDYEGELAVVLKKDCRNAGERQAAESILGYTIANDVSARKWQFERGGGQWVRGKSFDTFAPLGPWLVTPDEIGDPDNLEIKTTLNGEVVQHSNTKYMIRNVFELISFLSQGTTLSAGTIILTGTPEGVGWFRTPKLLLEPGCKISIEIEKIGTLTNTVQSENQKQ
jgi:2-keto-4-pentenoate hydratase/2-oxohepta-3-ene-1,7-dioic acid hydratase in catechol pathway